MAAATAVGRARGAHDRRRTFAAPVPDRAGGDGPQLFRNADGRVGRPVAGDIGGGVARRVSFQAARGRQLATSVATASGDGATAGRFLEASQTAPWAGVRLRPGMVR